MNLYEFCERYKISLRKGRRIKKDGSLPLESGGNEHGAEIRFQLRKGQPLTVAHLIIIIEQPTIISQLWPYNDKAKNQLAALGDVRNEAAPPDVAACIADAAQGDEQAIGILIGWMKEAIPVEPVTHHWLAVRLLMGLQPNIRTYNVPRIRRAFLNCRNSTDFKGWWRVDKVGSRRITSYQQPRVEFDL